MKIFTLKWLVLALLATAPLLLRLLKPEYIRH